MNWRIRASSIAALVLCLCAPAPAQPVSTQAEWNAAVARQLQRKISMPAAALRSDTDLSLTLNIIVLAGGDIESVTVSRSSGNPSVDQATLAMIQRAGRLPAFPADMPTVKQAVSLPVRYSVADSHPAPPPAPAPITPIAPATKATKKTGTPN